MLARRVIALSPDKAFAKLIGTALRAAGGAVEVHTGLDGLGRGEIQASLIVVHVEGELTDVIGQLGPRLTGDGKMIAILPKPDLVRSIEILQQSPRMAGVLVAEHFRAADLAAMATRILAGDIFGLEKIVTWGTKIYSQLVGDYQEKSLCIAQVSEFAELMGVRRKYREAVEQVLDEMLMNALYDAPVDDQGRQIFAEIPTKTRISLRMEQKVVVQYACDDRTFSLSVRDSFGTLERDTVIRYIDKCLHSDQQIDRKTGGAGLGLYLMANSTSRMFFNVLPGVATEAVATFELDQPKIQLQKLGFFQERIDAAGRLAAGPSRLLPVGVSHPVERRRSGDRTPPSPAKAPATVVFALSAAILLLLVLIGLVAYPRFQGKPQGSFVVMTTPYADVEVPGEHRETAGDDGRVMVDHLEAGRTYTVIAERAGYRTARTQARADSDTPPRIDLPLERVLTIVAIDSDPPGATVVTADGRTLGQTPLEADDFDPGADVTLILRKAGYTDEKVVLRVPAAGGHADVMRELEVAADIATILVVSEPPGAEVYLDGQKLAGVTTPSDEILVEAGKTHTVKLELAGHAPATVTVSPGRGARGQEVSATLAAASTITVKSTVDARISIEGVRGCEKKATPATCTATAGRYTVKLEATRMPGKMFKSIEVKDAPIEVNFQLGIIEAPRGTVLLVGGKEVSRAAFEAGKKVRVTVQDGDGVMTQVEVRPEAGKTRKAE
jgi:hypothetical protein